MAARFEGLWRGTVNVALLLSLLLLVVVVVWAWVVEDGGTWDFLLFVLRIKFGN